MKRPYQYGETWNKYDTEKDYRLCPEPNCGKESVGNCKCHRADTLCSNKHWWHIDGEQKVQPGSSHKETTAKPNTETKEKDWYKVLIDGKVQVGLMVGRVAEPSHNDIELQFEDGTRRWFRYENVTKIEKERAVGETNAIDNKTWTWSQEDILNLWPQAYQELREFRGFLTRNSGLTASQLGMALQLANAEFERLKKEKTHE